MNYTIKGLVITVPGVEASILSVERNPRLNAFQKWRRIRAIKNAGKRQAMAIYTAHMSQQQLK